MLPAPPVLPPPGLPPTPPGPPGEPVFLLSRLLKKLARTPSLVAPATRWRGDTKNTQFIRFSNTDLVFQLFILNKHIKERK